MRKKVGLSQSGRLCFNPAPMTRHITLLALFVLLFTVSASWAQVGPYPAYPPPVGEAQPAYGQALSPAGLQPPPPGSQPPPPGSQQPPPPGGQQPPPPGSPYAPPPQPFAPMVQPPPTIVPAPSPIIVAPPVQMPRWVVSLDALWLERNVGSSNFLGYAANNIGGTPSGMVTDTLYSNDYLFPLVTGLRLQLGADQRSVGRRRDVLGLAAVVGGRVDLWRASPLW